MEYTQQSRDNENYLSSYMLSNEVAWRRSYVLGYVEKASHLEFSNFSSQTNKQSSNNPNVLRAYDLTHSYSNQEKPMHQNNVI
jgi:hypothetical protein